MPSAQTVVMKPEKSAVQDPSEPYKTVLGVIEKKVRNLEKRKEKLDGYKKLLASGQALNEDQKNAVALYPDVISSLFMAQELSKQFAGLATDFEKTEKKRKKKEAQERLLHDSVRIKEVLLVQDILNNMSPELHDDFINGTNGACQLTEEQLKKLDEFFPLIDPREELEGNNEFQARLASSAEHLANLLEGKPKDIIGTTYRELREVVFKIADSKYFEAKPQAQPEVVEPEPEPEPELEAIEPEVVAAPDNGYLEEAEVEPEEPVAVEPVPSVPKIETTHFYRSNVPVPEVVPVLPAPVSVIVPRVPVIAQPADVISDVLQGGAFNFIQDSELESPIPHPVSIDPAIMMVSSSSFPAPFVSLANIPVSYAVPVSLGIARPPSPPPQIPLPTREELAARQKEAQLEADSAPVLQTSEESTTAAPVTDAPVSIDNWGEENEAPKEESNVWQTRDRQRERGGYRGARGDYRGDYRGGYRGRGERREGGYQNGRGGGRGRDDRYNDRPPREGGYGDRERNYERRERNYDDREQGSAERERYSYDRSNAGERGRGGFRGPPRGGNRGGEPRGRGGYGRGGYSDRGDRGNRA